MNRRNFFMMLLGAIFPFVRRKESVPSGYIIQWHGSKPPKGWISRDSVIGCLFEIPNLITLSAAATYVLPPGEGHIQCVAGTTTGPVYQWFQGTTSPAWTTLFTFTAAATTLLHYYASDGANMRVNNLAATASTFTIYQWR